MVKAKDDHGRKKMPSDGAHTNLELKMGKTWRHILNLEQNLTFLS
jgi:hypothetical protein